MKQRLFKMSAMVLMLVLVSGLCACKSTEAKWQEQYDLGMKYVSEGNYEEAIIAFAAAIEIDPNNADAYIGRADAYLALGSTEENLASARADYEKAAELSGTAEADSGIAQKIAQAYESLADGYIDGDDWNKAVEILQQELEACGETESLTGKLAELGLMVNENGEIQPDYSQGMRVALTDAQDTGSSDNYYLTDTQREEILRPMISKVRYFYEYGKGMAPDEPYSEEFLEYGRILAGLYYIMGELEQCLEVRTELYQQTGEEYLNPEGYVAAGNLTSYYNSYGVMARQEGSGSSAAYGVWINEYDQTGKPLGSTRSYGDGRPDESTEILYENGRIVKEVFHQYLASGDGRGNVTYTPIAPWWDYEYGEGQVIIRTYDSAGELAQIGTVTLNEYGFEEETQWEDLY